MIEPTALLKQMELLIQKAQQNPTATNVREQLTAVRALCDVVLQGEPNASVAPEPYLMQNPTEPRALPKRAEIESQNDSIFDF